MSDSITSFIATSYGGGSDGAYGNYGGAGVGPTSYNPYGTGSPGQSTYIGAGTAAPNYSSVTNPYSGRVTNNTTLTVTDKAADHTIATGTPAQLIDQADAIINVATHDNQYMAANYRAPVIYVPNLPGAKIDFGGSSQVFKDYLNRSVTFLIPETTLANTFSVTLGRAATSGDVANMETAVNTGGSVGTIQ